MYSKPLSDIIEKCLQKDCRDRPTIQQILEHEALLEAACELGIIVPTEDEVKALISSQKTDFMTTFAKKKKGTSSDASSGPMGLVSGEKLKKKQAVSGSNIKNNPPVKSRFGGPLPSQNKNKLGSKSAMVEVSDLADNAIEAVDKIVGGSEEKKKEKVSIANKYKHKKQGAISHRLHEQGLQPGVSAKGNDKSKKLKNTASSSSSNIKPSIRPKSGYNPKRDYAKPWQKPKTAEQNLQDPKLSKRNSDQKEKTKKRANDIMANRKRQIRPIIVKKSVTENIDFMMNEKETKHKHRFSQLVPGIKINDLEDEVADEIQKDQPVPFSAELVSKPRRGIKKIHSHDVNKTGQLRIPLQLVDEDFAPRNRKFESEGATLFGNRNSDHAEEVEAKKPANQYKNIADIRRQRQARMNHPIGANSNFVDETSGITCESGSLEENVMAIYLNEDEEEKNAGSGSSNGSNGKEYNLLDDDEDFINGKGNPYDYADSHFDDGDERLLKTPFGDFGLDEINEEDELYDETAFEKRHLKERMKELEKQIKEKWNELNQQIDSDALKKSYNYFTRVIQQDEDADDPEKVEDVHRFIKKQGIKDYKEVVFK